MRFSMILAATIITAAVSSSALAHTVARTPASTLSVAASQANAAPHATPVFFGGLVRKIGKARP